MSAGLAVRAVHRALYSTPCSFVQSLRHALVSVVTLLWRPGTIVFERCKSTKARRPASARSQTTPAKRNSATEQLVASLHVDAAGERTRQAAASAFHRVRGDRQTLLESKKPVNCPSAVNLSSMPVDTPVGMHTSRNAPSRRTWSLDLVASSGRGFLLSTDVSTSMQTSSLQPGPQLHRRFVPPPSAQPTTLCGTDGGGRGRGPVRILTALSVPSSAPAHEWGVFGPRRRWAILRTVCHILTPHQQTQRSKCSKSVTRCLHRVRTFARPRAFCSCHLGLFFSAQLVPLMFGQLRREHGPLPFP